MAYRVRLLYFQDPVAALDSKGSLAGHNKVGGGAAIAESIRRVPQGYLVGWKNKVFFVPDSRIACAEIEDEEAEVAPPPQTGHVVGTIQIVTPQVQAAATATPAAPVVLGPPPEPGSIVMDAFGRYSRVPFPDAKPAAPPAAAPIEPAAEPSPEAPAHTMTRSPRRRGSMSAKHETQPPTSLEAAVAADEEQDG